MAYLSVHRPTTHQPHGQSDETNHAPLQEAVVARGQDESRHQPRQLRPHQTQPVPKGQRARQRLAHRATDLLCMQSVSKSSRESTAVSSSKLGPEA